MSERLSITPLGPYIGAQVSGADLTRPLSDNQFEQLYHAVLRHQVVFLREQNITPAQQRDLALRFGDLHIHPVYPHAPGVEEIIVLDTHNDNPPLAYRCHFYRHAARRRHSGGERAADDRRGHPVDQRHRRLGSAVRTLPAAAERPACRTRFPQIVPGV